MAEARDAVREVRLRPVEDQDLGVFFEHQADPEANEMAAFPARGKDESAAHWARVRVDDTSVLRTIEILLGLPPMSAYDAGAPPLSAAFTATPNLAPFDALPARIDVKAKNGATAYRAADSARFDLAEADRVDDAVMNDVLWHAVKGARATPPPYGLFPHRDDR